MNSERVNRGSADGFWRHRRVLVTGGGGFVGSAVVRALGRRGVSAANIVIPRSRTADLRDFDQCRRVIAGCEIVVHLAARTGGVAFARAHPGSQYRDCSLINLNLLEAARAEGVARFVALGNLLAYPAIAKSPLTEEALHDGPVALTHTGVGLAKRDLVALVQMFHREFGLDAVCVLGANAYGPRDRFDLACGHVIPATIMKCALDEDLVVWGDGSPTRDFLFVDDLAEGILLAAEKLEAPQFVNIASGEEVSIAHLVRLIAEMSGFRRRIVFDPSKGTGDPRRVASPALARQKIGFAPRTPLREGLRLTIEWYRSQVAAAA